MVVLYFHNELTICTEIILHSQVLLGGFTFLNIGTLHQVLLHSHWVATLKPTSDRLSILTSFIQMAAFSANAPVPGAIPGPLGRCTKQS